MNKTSHSSQEYAPRRPGRLVRVLSVLCAAALLAALLSGCGLLRRQARGGDMACDITEPFEDVSVQGISCDVSFSVGGDTCVVEYHGPSRMACTAEVKNGTLVIQEKLARRLSLRNLFNLKDSRLTVFLPQRQYDELTLEIVSGDIDMPSGDVFRDLELMTVSGDIKLAGAGGGDVTVETVSGDVEIRDGRVSQLKVRTTSGSMELTAVLAEDQAALRTVSGNIDILSSDAESLEISTTSGDVHTALQTAKEYVTHTTSGEVTIASNVPGAGRCGITTVSGDIRCE